MFIPTRGVSLDSLATASNPSSRTRATPSQTNTSFAQEFVETLESYLNGAATGSHFEIDILPAQAGDSGTRQFLVTVKDPDSATGPAPNSTVATTPAPEVKPPTVPEATPITNEVDAYWATQPSEVQVLRTIEDPEERAAMGQKLASQGFVIDPNIMIHRWDPYMTMKIRQGEGYTWVPAIGQNGIPVSPGLNFPGLPHYDPDNPPAGSVHVTTDFAIGLEHTSPGAGNTNFSRAVGS